jgi:REP element-mobilizing transposase RayT
MGTRPYHDLTHLYFVTATVQGWKRLFAEEAYAQIVIQSLDWHRRQRRWLLFAFVVMPDHAHWIVKPLGQCTISAVLQTFGSYTAHTIVDQLAEDGSADLLAYFAQRWDRDTGKNHQIWLPLEARNVYSAAVLRQKMEYIHNNPIAKRWSLVEDRAEYVYSTACFYDRGIAPIIPVDDVSEWL